MYRWWTVKAFRDKSIQAYGLKLGPVTVYTYRWDGRRHYYAGVLCRWSMDTGIRAHGGHLFHVVEP